MNYLYAIQLMIWLLFKPASSDYNPNDFKDNNTVVEHLQPTPTPKQMRSEP